MVARISKLSFLSLKTSIYILLMWIITYPSTLNAQISYGGSPIPQSNSTLETITLPALNLGTLKSSTNKPFKTGSLHFAHPIFVSLNTSNSGMWSYSNQGMAIWQLAIKSEGAKSLNLIFDKFYLPAGAQLFVYNRNYSSVLGAFTSANNRPSKTFAIAPVQGDEIIIEIQCTPDLINTIELEISAVNHDFLDILNTTSTLKAGSANKSQACNVNAVCGTINSVEANNSVCKIIVDGTELCSGTMMNNTANDGKPYFLTAAHCITKQSANDQTVIFYFNYQTTTCQSTSGGNSSQTLSGAQLKAIDETLDFALLEMTETPPITYNAYLAGWNRNASITGPVYALHHPQGDVKKLAIDNDSPKSATFYLNTPSGLPFEDNSHWLISKWETGTTERGSSGCGLFNSKAQVIGSLSGGDASCENSINDYFQRLNKSWDTRTAINAQLKYWLDPLATNVMELNGKSIGSVTVPKPPSANNKNIIIYQPVINHSFTYKTDSTGLDYLQVYSLNGQLVYEQNCTAGLKEGTIVLPQLASSTYLFVFWSNGTSTSKKITVK